MIESHGNVTYVDLQNCILYMVPIRRQQLLVFQTTQEAFSNSSVEQLIKLYWKVSIATPDYNHEVSRSTLADGNH
eukprot:6638019-Ditylum_brightwellii.AAC.1